MASSCSPVSLFGGLETVRPAFEDNLSEGADEC